LAASEPDEEGTTPEEEEINPSISVDLFPYIYAWIYAYMPMPIYTYIHKYLGRFGARRGRHDAGGGGGLRFRLSSALARCKRERTGRGRCGVPHGEGVQVRKVVAEEQLLRHNLCRARQGGG